MDTHPEESLAEALIVCGVDPEQVATWWDEVCREDVLTFSGRAYSGATLARLADLYLTFPSRFIFATDVLQDAFERVLRTSPTRQRDRDEAEQSAKATLDAHGLSDFAVYDPSRETLEAFALRVETACGFAAGDMLSVSGDDHISIRAARPFELKFSDFEVLLPLLGRCAPGIRITAVSEDLG